MLIDGASVVIKPEAAKSQLDEERTALVPELGTETVTSAVESGVQPGAESEPSAKVVRRFFGVKTLDPQRVSRDADQIATEIVTHLVGLVGADVDVKIEITAHVPEGVPDAVVRTVTENAKSLKFDQHGFEEN